MKSRTWSRLWRFLTKKSEKPPQRPEGEQVYDPLLTQQIYIRGSEMKHYRSDAALSKEYEVHHDDV